MKIKHHLAYTKIFCLYYLLILILHLNIRKCRADDYCDNYSCARHYGVICNGSPCHCGICHCNPGRTGLACELRSEAKVVVAENDEDDDDLNAIKTAPLSKVLDKEEKQNFTKSFCVEPDSRKICNGNGHCHQNRCRCHGDFYGDFCEICPTCHKHKCKEYKACVHCLVTTIECDDECGQARSSSLQIEFVNLVKNDEDGDVVYCQLVDENNSRQRECRFYFVFGQNVHTGQEYVRVQKNMDCSNKVSSSNDSAQSPSLSLSWTKLIIICTIFLIFSTFSAHSAVIQTNF